VLEAIIDRQTAESPPTIDLSDEEEQAATA